MSYIVWTCLKCGKSNFGNIMDSYRCTQCGVQLEVIGLIYGIHICHGMPILRYENKFGIVVFTAAALGSLNKEVRWKNCIDTIDKLKETLKLLKDNKIVDLYGSTHYIPFKGRYGEGIVVEESK